MTTQENLEMAVLLEFLADRGMLEAGKNITQTYVNLIQSRDIGGSGFMTVYRPDPVLQILPDTVCEDVSPCEAVLNGEEKAVGFVIMVKHGRIMWLEGFDYEGGLWPKNLQSYRVVDA